MNAEEIAARAVGMEHEVRSNIRAFNEKLRAWVESRGWMHYDSKEVQPFTLTEDHKNAMLYRHCGGWTGMILATLLFISMFSLSFEAVIVGMILGFALPMLVSAPYFFAFRNAKKPVDSVRKIPGFYIAVAMLGISFVFWVLPFVMSAHTFTHILKMSGILSPIFGIALYLLTISIIVLSGIFLAFSHELDWSYRASCDYKKVWGKWERVVSKTKVVNQ